jgi:3-oxoadipate enol-lactonase
MLNSVESDSVYSLIDFEQLARQVTVFRYNYGDKSVSGHYTWEFLADELLSVIDNQKIDQSILGGLSMGAGTILHAAVNYPERVKAMILVTPPPAWESREEVKKVYRKIASKTNPENIPEFLRRIVLWNQDPPQYYEQLHPGIREKLQNLRLAFNPAYYTRLYLDGANSDMPSREQISQLSVPTLIIALDQDANHPIEMADELHALIKSSEIEVIANLQDHRNLQKKVHKFIVKVLHDNKS